MSYDPHEKKSHFLLIMVFISVLAKMSAHFSLEIFLKMNLGMLCPFYTFLTLRWDEVQYLFKQQLYSLYKNTKVE